MSASQHLRESDTDLSSSDWRLFVVAGEASGDQLGAEAVRALREIHPGLQVRGMGGPALEAEGMERLVDAREVAVVGIFEVVRCLPTIVRAYRKLVGAIADWRPRAVLLIDFPDFNLRLARSIRRLQIPILYYVSPQLWAWRRGRIRTVAQVVDHMMVIFPFEEQLYQKAGIPVTYVGHPVVDRLQSLPSRPKGEGTKIALLPGSRSGELRRILPVLVKASEILRKHIPELQTVLVKAPTVRLEELRALLEDATYPLEITSEPALAILREVDAALVASGTATLEAAVAKVPMVVVYRVSWLTYALARLLVRGVSSIGMVNLIAGRNIVPERIQRLEAEELASLMLAYLGDPERCERTQAALSEILPRLGPPGAAGRVARIVEKFMERSGAIYR